jgi:two-component system sensor histidine kinase/response regulator
MTSPLQHGDHTPPPPVKCLIVDDLEENLLALSALLRRDDVELLQARSGAEALELLLVHDVALAFLDVQMPDMDGFELAELMRGSERTRHVPLIFVTAGARDQYPLFKGYNTGAVDFLYKPIDPYILQSKADVFFQLHRQKLQLAEELRERTETLRLNELFTAVLGHDLRNPLSSILMSAHLLQRRSSDEAVQKVAARLLSSGKWMSRMIADMLDLARARLGGGISIRCAPTDLAAVVQGVVQDCQAATPECQIHLHPTGDLSGEWDADRLAQVALNLIGNALQHGVQGRPVDVRLDGSQAEVVAFSVENEGAIPAEVLPHVFDPFRGGQRLAGRSEGLGLGLYIVQQIILAHQGHVDVRSTEDGRTVFRITVPRHAKSMVAATPA